MLPTVSFWVLITAYMFAVVQILLIFILLSARFNPLLAVVPTMALWRIFTLTELKFCKQLILVKQATTNRILLKKIDLTTRTFLGKPMRPVIAGFRMPIGLCRAADNF